MTPWVSATVDGVAGMMIIAHTNMNSRDCRTSANAPNHRPTGIEQRDGGRVAEPSAGRCGHAAAIELVESGRSAGS